MYSIYVCVYIICLLYVCIHAVHYTPILIYKCVCVVYMYICVYTHTFHEFCLDIFTNTATWLTIEHSSVPAIYLCICVHTLYTCMCVWIYCIYIMYVCQFYAAREPTACPFSMSLQHHNCPGGPVMLFFPGEGAWGPEMFSKVPRFTQA